MSRLDRSRAREILRQCRAPIGGDFHALPSDTVAALLGEADAYGYRKPRNANGSRGRYWHGHLQRVAGRAE
jgi:hypothetical protein